eukprot:3640515-Pyramimonas_sp.AAC.1
MINRRLEMGPRIAHLVQKQKIAAMPLKKMISKFGGMTRPAKTNLVDTLANVHLTYLAETWTALSESLLQRLETPRIATYRVAQ